MSVLTKLFVVLLVICSLLLTAATTVFVNRVEDFRAVAGQNAEAFRHEKSLREALERQAQAAEANHASTLARMNGALTELNSKISQGNQDKGALQTRINDLKSQLDLALASNGSQSEAVKALQAQIAALTTRYEAAVKDVDQARTRMAELASANVDFEKRLEEAERERRFLNEQVIQLQADKNRLTQIVAENHLNPDSPAGAPNVTAPDIRVNVQSVKQQDGQTYATINAGSNDRVQKGMQFTIIDAQTGDFIGKLTVEQVEPGESWGRVEGPKVNAAKKGDFARTRI